jgi:Flp pilus assembly pilin Flp
MRRLSHLVKCEDGAEAVEFALIVPLLVTLLFGIFEFARAVWTQSVLDYAVEQAARCASVNTTACGTSSAIATFASQQTSPINVPAADFAATTPSCGHQVVASYTFNFIGTLALIGGQNIFPSSITLSSTSCYPI